MKHILEPRIRAIATLCLLGVLIQVHMAQEPGPTPPVRRITHLVVIIQENISFDHYFATYPLAANLPENRYSHSSRDAVRERTRSGPPNQKSQLLPAVSARSLTAEEMRPHPAVRFWPRQERVMDHYDGNTVTGLWNYVQHFAMSDNFFGTTFGQSSPGHVNIVSGQTHGLTVTRADPDVDSVVVDGTMSGPAGAAFDDCSQTTGTLVALTGLNIGDLLNAKGISWGYFHGGFAPTSRNQDGSAVCGSFHTAVTGISTLDYTPNHQPFQK